MIMVIAPHRNVKTAVRSGADGAAAPRTSSDAGDQ
jgi:hypothetical protein